MLYIHAFPLALLYGGPIALLQHALTVALCLCCRMIDAGQVFAQIDEAAGMVRFLEDPERYDTARVLQRIDEQMQQSIAVSTRLKQVNQRVRSLIILKNISRVFLFCCAKGCHF